MENDNKLVFIFEMKDSPESEESRRCFFDYKTEDLPNWERLDAVLIKRLKQDEEIQNFYITKDMFDVFISVFDRIKNQEYEYLKEKKSICIS